MNWVNWYLNFAAENIYGFLPIMIVVYFVFVLLRKIFSNLPHPGVFVGLAFFIALFTIPSMPRFNFEKEILSKYSSAGEFKLVNKAGWGALHEPITLINTPTGFFHYVMPVAPAVFGSFDKNMEREFRSKIHRFDEPEISQIVNVNCPYNSISKSEPQDGIFRYTHFNEQMNDSERKIYCETDYEPEVRMFQCKYKILSKLSDVTEEATRTADAQCKSE